MPEYLFNYTAALVFLVAGLLFLLVTMIGHRLINFLILPKIFGEKRPLPTPIGLSPYECGEKVVGTAWIRFNVRFYIIALIFLIFDVEIAVLFPWAIVFRELLSATRLFVLVEMAIFVGILLIGLAYVWVKGDLRWVRPGETD